MEGGVGKGQTELSFPLSRDFCTKDENLKIVAVPCLAEGCHVSIARSGRTPGAKSGREKEKAEKPRGSFVGDRFCEIDFDKKTG